MNNKITRLNVELRDMLIDQFYKEIKNKLIYLNLSSKAHEMGLYGFQHFFNIQSQEEDDHAMKIKNYLLKRNETILQEKKETPFNMPNLKEVSARELIEIALKQEVSNTNSLSKIMKKSEDLDDYSAQDFLMWFIKEQVDDEEYLFYTILKKFDLSINIRLIDNELGKRDKEDDYICEE
jgi:ferritin